MQTRETADLDRGANADLHMSRWTKRTPWTESSEFSQYSSARDWLKKSAPQKKTTVRVCESILSYFGRDNSDCSLKTKTFLSMKLATRWTKKEHVKPEIQSVRESASE